MGGFKDIEIPHAEDGYEDWLDDHALPTNNLEIEILRRQMILCEVVRLGEWCVWKLDRIKNYGESVAQEEIEFLLKETQRIERDLG